MEIATLILLRLTGLYAAVGMGYFATRRLAIDSAIITRLLFYLIIPLVFFHGIGKLEMRGAALLLPPTIFVFSCLFCLMNYRIGHWLYPQGREANIIGFSAGAGNNGFFGIPVALALFDTQTVALYMVLIIGVMLYEATLGYYITTRGDFTPMQAVRKIFTLPPLHGALLGLLFSLMDWKLPAFTEDFFIAIRGTYTMLGMMLVGMALAAAGRFSVDWKFIAATFGVKFIAWPLAMGALIWLDAAHLHLFDADFHRALLLFAVVPLAVNTVIYATLLNVHPEKMATAVFLSTLFALAYVPLLLGWW